MSSDNVRAGDESEPATTGMRAGGYYDEHSEYQARVAQSGAALIDEVAGTATLPEHGTFVLVDYGCSTGANSIGAARTALSAVRKRRALQSVAVVHNDVVTNDFNELFANVETRDDSYLTLDGPRPLVLGAARSFFEPVVPTGSAHLGLSFSAAHWLRSQPAVDVPEGFYFSEATGEVRAVLAAEAAADWATFLSARAEDLAAGGRLLVQMVGAHLEDGAELVTARKLLEAMSETARELAGEGKLAASVVDRYILPVYARTVEEAGAPLREGGVLASRFAVDAIRTDPVTNPYLDQWRTDGDAAVYGRSYAAFVRGFTESNLREHLFAGNDGLLDEYFDRLEARFAADPLASPFEDWTLTIVLTRR
ncbi:MAG TPA: hypothetical protein VM121_02980 [Acidimicrobiales bacterium]|nr:hypothetical protein [Acidimicrobiales bacterium]